MGIIADIRAAWSAPSVSDDGHWTTQGRSASYGSMSGVVITEDVALSNPVVFDCVNILMDAVGQSPAVLYDRTGDDSRERAQTPLAYRLREQPNDEQTAIEFKREMQQTASLYPTAYAEVEWRGAEPVNIWPRHPARLRVRKVGSTKRYEHLEDDGITWRPILPADMLRVPGRPVLRYAGETIGRAIALERYSARLFGRGVKPSALISTSPDEQWDETAKDRLRDEIEKEHGGADKAGGVLILTNGLKYTPMSMTNQEAEYAALLSGITGDLARYWRIPPYMIGLLESGTVSYASVNTQGVDFVVYCLMPWLIGWEQAMQRDLIVLKDTQFVEFLTAALLRGTTKERYEVYQIALNTKDPVTGQPIMSVDEVRRLENLNPHDRGYQPAIIRPETPAVIAARVDDGSPAQRYLHAIVHDAAGRVMRREQSSLAKLAEKAGPDAKAWESGVHEFYAEHGRFVSDALKLPPIVAADYVQQQVLRVLTEGPAADSLWDASQADRLTTLALTEGLREAA